MDTSSESTRRETGEELLRHVQWLRRLARELVNDPLGAEDLVQDACVAALREPPRAGRAWRPWLRTVVQNAAFQRFRARGRRTQRERDAREPAQAASPGEAAERLDTERRLTDELARLEEPLRTTLMLRYYDGLEPTEIARRLGVPAGTVRWRVKRGLDTLRERLDQSFGERSAWCALLLPLAGGRELAAAGLAGSAATMSGVLAMNALTKSLVGAAAVAALAITLGVTGVLPDSLWPFRVEPVAPLAVRPYAPPPEAIAPELAEANESPRTNVSHATPAPVEAVAASAAEASRSFVDVRAVDEAGNPIPAARLDRLGVEGSARAGGDGRMRLELEDSTEAFGASFELGARGFASLRLEAVVHPGESVHLGTQVLAPGGAVSGRVVDVDGRPIANASIQAGDAGLPQRDLDTLRLQPAGGSVPSTRTDEVGHFTLDRLAEGQVRIWARAPEYLAGFSPPVQVRAGEEAYGLELVLQPTPRENQIVVSVLDPDGKALPGAMLEFRMQSPGIVRSGSERADAEGRHTFVVSKDTRASITAKDPEDRYGPASAADLRPGDAVTRLRLSAAEPLAIQVHELGGAPVELFGFALLSADGSSEQQSAPRATRAGGRAQARLPRGDFFVSIDAPGHELARLGPFSPGAVKGPIEVALAPVPGIHGRVLSNGEAVAGARVRLHARVAPGQFYEKNGFVSLWQDEVVDEVHSDSDGRFVLTVREAGEYAARAEKPGFAPGVSELVRVGAGLSAPELDLQLTEGGAIEGHVLTARGADPAGTIVGLTRADGYDRTLRVGADGAYRFERLTPGEWRLTAVDEEIVPGRINIHTSPGRGEPIVFEGTCSVRAGETSVCDLELADRESCALNGRFLLDGVAPGPWWAWIVPEGRLFDSEPKGRVSLDPEGRFRVTAAESGSYQLVVANTFEGSKMQWVIDAVHLHEGEQSWERDVPTGTMVLASAPAWDGEGIPAAVHLWHGAGELRSLTVIAGEANEPLRVRVPAGPSRLAHPEAETRDFDRWPTLVDLDVPRGGEVAARLP